MKMKFGNSIFKTFFLSLCIVANTSFAYAQTASILPPAKTTFVDQNGKPLTGGTVDFYVPGTTTHKTTWQDSAEATPNANPVILDAAGRALILGDGAYRQVVKDRNGNLIWDQITSSLGSGSGSTTTIGDGLPVGTILPNSGFVAPANYQFAYGQALLRSTYANLFSAITISTSIGCVGGSPLINVSDTSSLSVGAVLESICVSGSPTVIAKTSSTVTMSSNATVTVSTNGVFFPYGNGNGLTTFNVPDLRGYVAAGRCNMGGVDCSVLNSTYFSSNVGNSPSGMNAKGGSQNKTLALSNLPPYTPSGTVTAVAPNSQNFVTGTGIINVSTTAGGSPIVANPIANSSSAIGTFIGTPQGGTSTSFSLVQPTLTLNYVVKVSPDSNLTSTFGVGSIGGMTGIIACGSGVTCSANTISFSFVGVNAIQGMTGNITCGSGLTCSGNSIVANGVNPSVIQSRTAAAALDLSIYSAVQTLGYSSAGDGGGAQFQKTAGNFLDTRALAGSITANGTSGCTNGTYYGVDLDGGSGRGLTASISVIGGVVTAVAPAFTSSAGYAAGDVLSIGSTVPGCAGVKTYTLSSVTTPTGSFTDAAGNKWQIIFPAAGLDARSMGVKFDWDGTDGSSTDNFTTLQNALSFAYYKTTTRSDLGGAIGGQVLLTKGTAMVGCSGTASLVSPQGVKVKGQGNYTSVIKFCDTFSVGVNQWELCDKNSHLACFGTLLEDFQIFNAATISGTSSRSVVYTDNAQHEAGMRRMTIYPGGCGRGVTYETGYGGATYILLDGVELKGGKSDANCGGAGGAQVYINYGSTQVIVNNLNVSGYSAGSGGPRAIGLAIDGGFVDIVGFHTEQVVSPATINIPTDIANGMVRARSVVGGVDCVGLFSLSGVNKSGNFMLSPPMAINGCTRLVTNGQSGATTNLTSVSSTDVVFTPDPHAW